MPRTGDITERAGVFRGDCCGTRLTVNRDEKFPVCPACNQPTLWRALAAPATPADNPPGSPAEEPPLIKPARSA